MTALARTTWTAPLAFAAAASCLALVIVAVTAAPGDLADHTAAAGRLSEVFAGVSFLLGAAALATLVPRKALAWWLCGIVGLAASGATMVVVAATRIEPPIWVFWAEVALAAVGLVAVTVSAIRLRVLPWWSALGPALLLPAMFLLPANGIFMGLIWIGVGVGALRRRTRTAGAASAVAMLPS